MSTEAGRARDSVERIWMWIPKGLSISAAIADGLNLVRVHADLIVAIAFKMASSGDREVVTIMVAIVVIAEFVELWWRSYNPRLAGRRAGTTSGDNHATLFDTASRLI